MSAAPEVEDSESRDEMPAPGGALRFRRTSGSGVAQSMRGVRGGVLQKLRGFEKRAEEAELSPMALRLQKEEQPVDNDSAGKIVIYTTSMKAIRATHAQCIQVTRLFGALRVKFDIKDVLLHPDFMDELQERVGDPDITVPQVFISGEHVGDGEMIMDMNETGELSAMLKVFQREYVADCSECGGKRFVACRLCQGSKKGKRSSFGTLRCTQCNQHGLQPCPHCSGGPTGAEGSDDTGGPADDQDDVIEQPRRRAMTAPSRAKPGRLDVSGFEGGRRTAEDADGGKAQRQVRPLAASRLTQVSNTDANGDRETRRLAARNSTPALQLAGGEVRERMRAFQEKTVPEEPSPTAEATTSSTPNPVTASVEPSSLETPSSAEDRGGIDPKTESFTQQTREQRIQFALQLARSTDNEMVAVAKNDEDDDSTKRPSPLVGEGSRPCCSGRDAGTMDATSSQGDQDGSAATGSGDFADEPTEEGDVSGDEGSDVEGASFI